jgi:hypothetical protein
VLHCQVRNLKIFDIIHGKLLKIRLAVHLLLIIEIRMIWQRTIAPLSWNLLHSLINQIPIFIDIYMIIYFQNRTYITAKIYWSAYRGILPWLVSKLYFWPESPNNSFIVLIKFFEDITVSSHINFNHNQLFKLANSPGFPLDVV